MTWSVHKFGGTSLADAQRYRNAAQIVIGGADASRQAVIVSAMSGVTNALIELVERSSQRDAGYTTALRDLRRREVETVAELLPADRSKVLVDRIHRDFNDIEDILKALWLLQTEPRAALELISGYGELWSAQLLAGHIDQLGTSATWLDARKVLTVGEGQLAPYVDWENSAQRLGEWLEETDEQVVVVTGFVASNARGIPTTLGRNGSDYSASIFAHLLDASRIDIWTDVDGVMSANPRQVPDAVVLDEMSYDEAMELAYFGAKVIHPSTMAPAVNKGIPIWIRNTFKPEIPGTRIHALAQSDEESTVKPAFTVKGIATIDGMALVNLEGTSMIGVPGIANRLFGALRESGVSVVLISQGSSEHSICFAVPEPQADRARDAVEQAFFAERHHGQIQTIDVTRNCAILAVVGDHMAGVPGVASTFFQALGGAGVNIRAIAQGSSERNISAVIDTADATRAVRAVHAGFYLSPQTISVGIIGAGVVGGALLEQLGEQIAHLCDDHGIDLRVRAIGTSQWMWTDDRALDPAQWKDAERQPIDVDRFADFVQTDAVPHAVIVDATASDEIAEHYGEWLDHGIHVVTPNKRAGSGALDRLQEIRASGRRSGAHFLYETTVGAGLPIIQTLRDLIQTGDEVRSIEGIFSGTLAYLFNLLDGSTPFSEIVRQAKAKGYTEPDPRDDLSGTDVARKLVILGREIGLPLELDDVEVESLVPAELQGGSVESFLERVSMLDEPMQERFREAAAADEVLRYVGAIDAEGNARVSLRRYPATHPFGRIRLTDNIVEFRTRRYDENPLVVQGPGAGPDVTAGGIFADLLRLAENLGATR
jgi:aspartokinase/homoserine dehydrogenase 1